MLLDKMKNFFNRIAYINIMNPYTEGLLVTIILCCVVLLVISQIGLTHETTRAFFTDIEYYEGVDINDIEAVFRDGEIALQLIGIEPTEDIKVLLNGFQAYDFTEQTLRLKVRNNCLIEVDGTKVKTPFSVKIVEVSDNIATNCKDNEIELRSGIEVLTRIFLK